MEIESILRNRLMGRTMKALEQALDFRGANQSVIAGNMANIETPGFTPKKATFNQALRDAVDRSKTSREENVTLRKTHEKHFPVSPDSDRVYTVETYGTDSTGSNRLNLDREMAKMAKNNLLYEASVTLLSKKFQALKDAIDAGRR
ncbi:MAG: flagellar basal body rod protein FlgB [Deltaproteobacteria bacterium]|nr:flagellar basal body rod protein FlgB [Deltaproteobacteria bacterium]